MIADNITHLHSHIASICRKLGRNAADITLVGVTKYAEVPQIQEAIKAGLTHLGENRVQDAQRKFSKLEESLLPEITKHMIGHLQSNKVKLALQLFDYIQSVDSLKLIQEIAKQAQTLKRTVDILLQVNTSGEKQKFGIVPQEVTTILEELRKHSTIFLKGLMTIVPFTDDKAVIRQCFRDLRMIRDNIREEWKGCEQVKMEVLSMGMSGDYEMALEEGSNMLRIGSAIFK